MLSKVCNLRSLICQSAAENFWMRVCVCAYTHHSPTYVYIFQRKIRKRECVCVKSAREVFFYSNKNEAQKVMYAA